MSFAPEEWIELATSMLGEEGAAWAVTRPAVVTRTSAGEVATPEETGLLVGVAARFSTREIDGKSILTGDVKFISDVGSWVMDVNDQVKISGVTYRCIDPGIVAPSGVPVISIGQFRRLGL